MNSATRDIILAIATDVRNWTQSEADRKDYRPDDLGGWCAIASGKLFTELKKENFKPVMAHDHDGHFFVLVEDHVVCVTATQFMTFKNVPVLLKHENEMAGVKYYEVDDIYEDIMEVRKYQKKHRWPSDQIIYSEYAS